MRASQSLMKALLSRSKHQGSQMQMEQNNGISKLYLPGVGAVIPPPAQIQRFYIHFKALQNNLYLQNVKQLKATKLKMAFAL